MGRERRRALQKQKDTVPEQVINPAVVLNGLRLILEAMYAYQATRELEGMCISDTCYLLNLMDPPRAMWSAKAVYALRQKEEHVFIAAHAVVVHNGVVFDPSYETAHQKTVYVGDLPSVETAAVALCPDFRLTDDKKRLYVSNFMAIHYGCALMNHGRSFVACPNGDRRAGETYVSSQHHHVDSVLSAHPSLAIRQFWTVVKGHYGK